MSKPKDISVIAPVYNEQENLPIFYRQLKKELIKLGKSYEIIFVDDGSTDSSLEILKKIRKKSKKVKIVSFRRNFGKSAALAVGFERAGGKVILTMDTDLQDRPDQISRLLKKISQGYDLVCGWRHERQDSPFKILSSLFYNKTTALTTSVPLHDMNCGFKAYTDVLAKSLNVYGELHRFIPVLAHWQGFKIGEVKIKHSSRRFGKSKFGLKRYLSGFFDLLTVMFLTRYIRKPLHVFGSIGLISFLLGSSIILFFMVRKYFFGILIGAGRPIIQIAVFLMISGLQFFIFGLLAEIITNSQEGTNRYLIKQEIG